jgi:hypothetical protein
VQNDVPYETSNWRVPVQNDVPYETSNWRVPVQNDVPYETSNWRGFLTNLLGGVAFGRHWSAHHTI